MSIILYCLPTHTPKHFIILFTPKCYYDRKPHFLVAIASHRASIFFALTNDTFQRHHKKMSY